MIVQADASGQRQENRWKNEPWHCRTTVTRNLQPVERKTSVGDGTAGRCAVERPTTASRSVTRHAVTDRWYTTMNFHHAPVQYQ
jgi:hypothetical protein